MRINCSHQGKMPAEPTRNSPLAAMWRVKSRRGALCFQHVFARRGTQTCCVWRGDGRNLRLAEMLLYLAQGAVSAG